jgi:hypothetical protein
MIEIDRVNCVAPAFCAATSREERERERTEKIDCIYIHPRIHECRPSTQAIDLYVISYSSLGDVGRLYASLT